MKTNRFLLILLIFFCSCGHKGVIIVKEVKPPAKSFRYVTITEKYDSIRVIDGDYQRLYKLSNDSLLWVSQHTRLYVKDSIIIHTNK